MSVDPEQLYEQTLVVRSQMGDEAGFGELLNLFGPRLLRFIEPMLQNSPDQVADLTQEIRVSIFRALPVLRDASKFRPSGADFSPAQGTSAADSFFSTYRIL